MPRRATLTTMQRSAILRQSDRHPEWRQIQLGQWAADTFKLEFVPSQPTISLILRQAGKALNTRGRKKRIPVLVEPKVVKCPQVEKAMLQWLEKQIEKDEAVTVAAVQTKAQELVHKMKVTVEGFFVSKRWVDSFMRHHVLNSPFGLSDSEDTGSEEKEEKGTGTPTAKEEERRVTTESGKVGKTSRRVVQVLVGRNDSRTPAMRATCPPAGKRKRDGEESTLVEQVKIQRQDMTSNTVDDTG